MRTLRVLIAVAIASVMTGCGYNTIVTQEQTVNASWSEVLNQYQRRADLIPNIVETVKGEANFEQSTLQNVIEARARATSGRDSSRIGLPRGTIKPWLRSAKPINLCRPGCNKGWNAACVTLPSPGCREA